MYATANSTLNLNGVNSFIGNRAYYVSGGGIWLDHSNVALNGFNHFMECAASYEGGAIFPYARLPQPVYLVTLPLNSIQQQLEGGFMHSGAK